jgi:hypothetical protein
MRQERKEKARRLREQEASTLLAESAHLEKGRFRFRARYPDAPAMPWHGQGSRLHRVCLVLRPAALANSSARPFAAYHPPRKETSEYIQTQEPSPKPITLVGSLRAFEAGTYLVRTKQTGKVTSGKRTTSCSMHHKRAWSNSRAAQATSRAYHNDVRAFKFKPETCRRKYAK